MQFGKTIVLAAIFLSNLENATGAEAKADDKQRQLATAAESGELESIGEDIALLKLDDKLYWNRFLQNQDSVPSAAPSAEPTAEDGDDDDDDDDDDGKLTYPNIYIVFPVSSFATNDISSCQPPRRIIRLLICSRFPSFLTQICSFSYNPFYRRWRRRRRRRR